jgi:hypothetical protein
MNRRTSGKEAGGAASLASQLVAEADASLLDLIDNVLNRGVVIEGEIVLGLADVDLIYLRLSVLVSAVDRVLGDPSATKTRQRVVE